MAKTPPEDHLLIEDQYPRLNKTFYASEPADYFERRLQLLALQSGNWQGLDDLLRQGVTIGELKIGYGDSGIEDPDGKKAARAGEHFATTEVVLLSHQVGETLLRLYLAHAFVGHRYPACPRLDVARLRRGSDFRGILESRFQKQRMSNEYNRRAVAKVFHYTDRANFRPEPDLEAWDRSLELHEMYLRYFANAYLGDGPLYNAAKHGLALTPEQVGMELKGIAKRDGPAIRYLAVKQSESNPRPRWHDVIHWVDADREMVHIYRGLSMIRRLWEVARYRYGDRSETRVGLSLMGGPSPWDLDNSPIGDSKIGINDMSIQLGYWKPADEVEDDADDDGADLTTTWVRPDPWPQYHATSHERPNFPQVEARCGKTVDYAAYPVRETDARGVPAGKRCAACTAALQHEQTRAPREPTDDL